MDKKFLNILCCPKTGQDFKLSVFEYYNSGLVKSGELVSVDGDYRYPIVNGVPRFVDKEFYSSSFGYEWKKWPKVQFEAENAGKPMAGCTRKMFFKLTDLDQKDLENKMTVEFGCGSGRFLDIIRENAGLAVGIDMSLAVDAARENFAHDGNVLIVQGDILNPPFKSGVFDNGFTIGVIHHTPDPAKALAALSHTVKSGGRIACAVYPKGSFYDYPSVFVYRKIHNFIAKHIGRKPAVRSAVAYAYFAAYVLYPLFSALRKIPVIGRFVAGLLERLLLVNVNLPDGRWRILDVFDAITPVIASTHTPTEMKEWFDKIGILDLRQTKNTAFTGVKQ